MSSVAKLGDYTNRKLWVSRLGYLRETWHQWDARGLRLAMRLLKPHKQAGESRLRLYHTVYLINSVHHATTSRHPSVRANATLFLRATGDNRFWALLKNSHCGQGFVGLATMRQPRRQGVFGNGRSA